MNEFILKWNGYEVFIPETNYKGRYILKKDNEYRLSTPEETIIIDMIVWR